MKRVACVTGADRGLGLSLVRSLLAKQFSVFAGQFLKESEDLKALKERYPDQLELIPLDISIKDSVKQAARVIASKTGYIDIIINNAGIIRSADNATVLVELDDEGMAEIYNVNTLGALRVSNALMGLLLQSEDKLIVNISSEAGSIARNKRINMYGYCMSKAALNMQSSLMHNHLRTLGGQVMVFHPGWLQTFMQGKKDEQADTTPEKSAEQIIGLVLNHSKYMGEEPAYLDMDGSSWPW
ncbi:NAD(P)-dependent dehydrogenase (short-subunit alcohol dehydrogenase family) [Paenibacillus sp. PastF-3]|uniref:SDR family NAD(P)-dependent oxidoreductase n=1 Tax=unclassified Paenibacillus TaxID=185978 RepID=UPI000BA060AA|nr:MULTISPECIES: SDR family NAD(P)-dependent oxidoreductase [unclassified Paenibacillus]MDH6373419.1 NAD(P)-dependent dehydrogenase (short-subunit alcohol dehydrogenase family) [Paenibacillus sp. PastF-3]OZQ86169.1 short-chain dehydrogenase [Paenibacillus sp. VTT E-133291]